MARKTSMSGGIDRHPACQRLSSNKREALLRRQACAQAVLGFLDLPKQLRDGSAAVHICVVAFELVENTLTPAIQGADLFAACEQHFVDNVRGAIENACWISLGKGAVQGCSFHTFLAKARSTLAH